MYSDDAHASVLKHVFPFEELREQMLFLGLPMLHPRREVFSAHQVVSPGWTVASGWVPGGLSSSYFASKNEMCVKYLEGGAQ